MFVYVLLFDSFYSNRLWLDVCLYVETLKDECSVNEILSSSSKNDVYVRLTVINYLSQLSPEKDPHRTIVDAVLAEAWSRYLDLAHQSTFRQFNNTIPHRHKHRLVQIFPLLDGFITEVSLCFILFFHYQGFKNYHAMVLFKVRIYS